MTAPVLPPSNHLAELAAELPPPRPVYDTPPVLVPQPRWPWLAAVLRRVRSGSRVERECPCCLRGQLAERALGESAARVPPG